MMRDVNEAYRVLSDPRKRAEYDALLGYERGSTITSTLRDMPPPSNFGRDDPLLRESMSKAWLVIALAIVLVVGIGLMGLVFRMLA